jgi:hypothetical protein
VLNAVDDVFDIIPAGFEVRVIHRIEDLYQRILLQFQSPLGVTVMLADQLGGCCRQGRIIQHQKVGVDKSGDVLGGVGRNLRADGLQLLAGKFNGMFEAPNLIVDMRLGQHIFHDIQLTVLLDPGLANGNASGNGNTRE